MTDTSYKIEVMRAFLDGEKIQIKKVTENDEQWMDCTFEPHWDWERCDYRIKHKSVPWTKDTCPLFCGNIVTRKITKTEYLVTGIDRGAVELGVCLNGSWVSYNSLLKDYLFEGKPCGS